MSASPLDAVKALWGGELPEFDSLDAVNERGISVSSAVMSFEHQSSPSTSWTRQATRISAHWDFSEDTYRTLTAVDSASVSPRDDYPAAA